MDDTPGNGTNTSLPIIYAANDTYLSLGTAFNSINIIIGLPINSYVLWLILSGAGGTIASEFFYLNLIVSVIISPLASVFYLAQFHGSVFLMLFFCAVFLYWFSLPSLQCCICVERYIAVVHPVVFLRFKALRYRVACCCVVWLTALAFSSFYFWSESWPHVLSYIFLGFYAVCISVVSFCCFSVLRALKQPGPGEGQRDSGEGNTMKRRAFRIILISLIVMVLTTMSCILQLMSSLKDLLLAMYITYAIDVMLGFVHPLLYIHKARKLPCFKEL